MKLVLFTDNLGSGGAQRQLCLLALEFQRLGHSVSVLTYNAGTSDDADFFGPWLDSKGIPRHRIRPLRRWQRPFVLRRTLVKCAPDAVLAFQTAPSLYAELAGLGVRRWGLVVSERNAFPGSQRGPSRWVRLFHRVADSVTTNSQANRELMTLSWPWLGGRVQVIYNAVDLQHFQPVPQLELTPETHDGRLQLVVLARYERQKNVQNILEAVLFLRGRTATHLRWYGGTRADKTPLHEGEKFIQANKLARNVELLPATRDPRQAYWASDAVLLASWYEGCPNVICEAMACGKPVLASAVSDNPLIVEDGVSGFLFDPHSPEAIADAIARLAELDPERRRAMGAAGRQRAESLFALESCARRYEGLLVSAAHARRERA